MKFKVSKRTSPHLLNTRIEVLTKGGSLDPVVGAALVFLRTVGNSLIDLSETSLTGRKVVSIPLDPVVSASLIDGISLCAGFVDLSKTGLRERCPNGELVALDPVVSTSLVLLGDLCGRFFELCKTGLTCRDAIPSNPVVGTSSVDSGRLSDVLLNFGEACMRFRGRCRGGGSRGSEESKKLEELHIV